jgi:4'-phosphopantetheinyl transferase
MPVPFFEPMSAAMKWPETRGEILPAGEIHVWKAHLEAQPERQAEFYERLSVEEKVRADRLRFGSIRQRFINAHAILRQILAGYLDQNAAEIEIKAVQGEKPVLAGKSKAGHRPWQFNLTHSRDLMLVSISRDFETGIDVEFIDPEQQYGQISNLFFSEADREWLDLQPDDQKIIAFFRLWTCKEAVLKTEGSGIRRSLKDVRIEFMSGAETARGILPGDSEMERAWAIKLFEPAPGYTTALAFEEVASAADNPVVIYFHWKG